MLDNRGLDGGKRKVAAIFWPRYSSKDFGDGIGHYLNCEMVAEFVECGLCINT